VARLDNDKHTLKALEKLAKESGMAKRTAHITQVFLSNVTEALPQYVFWKDVNSVYLGCNKNYALLVGLTSPESIIGKTDKDLNWQLGGHTTETFQRGDKETIAGKPITNQEEILALPNGTTLITLVSKLPIIYNGRVIGIVGYFTDITELKEKEKELLVAKQEAEAANRVKTEILENMRHDIRTPLMGLTGFAMLIAKESTESKIKEYAKDFVTSSYALTDLLNEILELIRVNTKEVPLQRKKFNLEKRLLDVINLNKVKALYKKIDLIFEHDERILKFVLGDPTRVHRIVLELITNALNFTNKGFVKLSTTLEEETEKKLIIKIEVEDTGIGIPQEKQEEVFLQFKRLTPSYKGIYKGAGLGLAIVKQFVDELEGELYVRNREQGGTCFAVLLPFTKPLIQNEFGVEEIPPYSFPQQIIDFVPEPTDNDTQKVAESTDKCPILLVEDQLLAAQVVKSILNQLNCSVDHVTNGKEALNYFKEKSYQLIFMDIGLPDIDGYEVTTQLRSLESDTHIPIIALTAHIDEENKHRCIKAGMDALLSKPLTKEKARDILNAFILYKKPLVETTQNSQDIVGSKDKILDVSMLNKVCLGKKELINEILGLVITDYPKELEKLKEAYGKKDWPALQSISHKLKGGASYCGAMHLMELCSQIDPHFREGEVNRLEDLSPQLIEELENLINEAIKVRGGENIY
jgi:two-component system aerobic respiration control sensor histidine kinase ArcB